MTALYRQLFLILGPRGKAKFLWLVVLALVAACVQLVSVASVFPLILLVSDPNGARQNSVLTKLYTTLDVSHDTFLGIAGTFMVLAILISNLINTLAIWMTQQFIADEQVRLSDLLLRKYVYKPYVFFLSQDSTSLCRDVLAEVGKFIGQFVQPLFDLVIRSATIIVIGGGLVLVNPAAALASGLVFGGGYLIVYTLCRTRLEELGRVRMETEIRKYKISWELLQGQREARLLNCRENFLAEYSDNSRQQQRADLLASLISQLPRQGIEVLGFSLVFFLILLFRGQGTAWQEIMPMLSLYAVGAVRLMPQFQSVFSSFTSLRVAVPVVERLAPELSGEIEEPVEATPFPWRDCIEFHNVSFVYPGTETPVLDGLNCRIQRGQQVGFVGTTGAGKTTLVNIILGLLSPVTGAITVDGKQITEENLVSWQGQLGFVPQDIFLCNDTVAANIAFGQRPDRIDMDRVRSAAERACLAAHIEALPAGYHSLVGERGTNFSGGQRQRLGIARALYREPSVLVLDEATSALDGRTEDDVMDALKKVDKDKTLILIAHRLTTLKDCHQIYLLDQGRVVDQGTYDQLMAKNETFRSFAKAP